MGFLDKNTRIIDMVLTGTGKELLAKGDLRFVYWSAFDDEIDYDPYISNSGSLNADELEIAKRDQIEASLVREAVTGYKTVPNSAEDTTNVIDPLFDMPQGQDYLPQLTSSFDGSEALLEATQRKVVQQNFQTDENGVVISSIGPFDMGFERVNGSEFSLELKYVPGSFGHDFRPDGFLVRIFQSGSDGLAPVSDRRDSNADITFNNDLILRLKE